MRHVPRSTTPFLAGTFAALAREAQTRDLPIVRKRFQGNNDTTADWPILCQRIVTLNPKAKKALRPFLPE